MEQAREAFAALIDGDVHRAKTLAEAWNTQPESGSTTHAAREIIDGSGAAGLYAEMAYFSAEAIRLLAAPYVVEGLARAVVRAQEDVRVGRLRDLPQAIGDRIALDVGFQKVVRRTPAAGNEEATDRNLPGEIRSSALISMLGSLQEEPMRLAVRRIPEAERAHAARGRYHLVGVEALSIVTSLAPRLERSVIRSRNDEALAWEAPIAGRRPCIER